MPQDVPVQQGSWHMYPGCSISLDSLGCPDSAGVPGGARRAGGHAGAGRSVGGGPAAAPHVALLLARGAPARRLLCMS